MKLTLLDGRHATYDAETWRRYDGLYRGGEAFREHLPYFLPRNPQEPEEVYSARKAEAHFTAYAGPIIDWFSAKVCAAALAVRATDEEGEPSELDPFYAEWKEDVDGAGTDLIDFVRARFSSALVKGRSWWIVEMPDMGSDSAPAASRAEWEARGLGNAALVGLDNEQVLDFEVDARGSLLWAIVHTCETPRPSPTAPRGRVRETWRIYDRADVETWTVEYDPAKEQRPDAARLEGRRPHGFTQVPMVRLGFIGTRGVRMKMGGRVVSLSSGALEGFWLMRRLADPQIAHFRNSAALDWNIKRTCYAMPVFKLADDEKPPTMGVGYYIKIGVEESAEWISPPTAHLAVLAERCEHLQQEIYRCANQMAQGVNNNAAAVGRSGESKLADAASTDVVLRVYGAICREAIEATYALLSEGRGEPVQWSIEGLDVFSTADATAVVDAVTKVHALRIPSVTLTRELYYRAAEVLLPNADQPTKDAIREEIHEGVEAQVELAEAMVPPPGGEEQDAAGADEEPGDDEPSSKPEPVVAAGRRGMKAAA